AGIWHIHSVAWPPFLKQLSEYACNRVFRPPPPVSSLRFSAYAKNHLRRQLHLNLRKSLDTASPARRAFGRMERFCGVCGRDGMVERSHVQVSRTEVLCVCKTRKRNAIHLLVTAQGVVCVCKTRKCNATHSAVTQQDLRLGLIASEASPHHRA